MKNYFCKNLPKSISLIIFFISLISLKGNFLRAEYLFEELEVDAESIISNDAKAT